MRGADRHRLSASSSVEGDVGAPQKAMLSMQSWRRGAPNDARRPPRKCGRTTLGFVLGSQQGRRGSEEWAPNLERVSTGIWPESYSQTSKCVGPNGTI